MTTVRNTKHWLLLLLSLLFLSSIGSAKSLYILGVDGFSLKAFKIAQEHGLFKDFKSVSGHIAPFPSMTDLSWSSIMRTPELFGNAGRIRSVEAVYFNESSKSVEGDIRDYYRRLGQPKYYLNGFQYIFNPYAEGLMYFPTEELPKLEIRTVVDGMAATNDSPLVTGYVGAIDSIAHTQQSKLYPTLKSLNSEVQKLIDQKRASGEDFELVLVSDHGNVGQFQEGHPEVELKAVEIKPVVERSGLRFVQQLEQQNDIAMPLLALGSWAPVYFKDSSRIPNFVNHLIQHKWFDLAFQLIERSPQKTVVLVTGAKGQARVHFSKERNVYYYEIISGNPLEIPQLYQSRANDWRPLFQATIEHITREGNYPDSILRVIDAAQSPHFDFPDLILTFHDGYYLNNDLGKMTKMFRTHGSLSRLSSMGIVASTARVLPKYLRSEEILSTFGIRPEMMFGKIAEQNKKSMTEVIRDAYESRDGIPTGAKNFSQKRIFQQMTKVIATSRPYFVIDEIKSFLSAFSASLSPDGKFSSPSFLNFEPEKLNAKALIDPNEIGQLTDLIIRNPDLKTIASDPHVKNLRKKFGFEENSNKPMFDSYTEEKNLVISGKRAVMKLYQIPALLDQSMVVQEKSFLPETRDLGFANYWDTYHNQLISPTNSKSQADRLFKEVYKEAILEDRIFPESLDSIYKKVPSHTTIVYVPGTYNGIFDREIFSLGLLSLQEDLGLRVLKAPVLSACSSEVNGEILLNFLKDDQKRYIARKENPPKYILLGYSKGGIDALYSFIQDKNFVLKNILGLFAMAAPLQGSSVLESADLPFPLVDLLINEKTPEICKKNKTATSSVTSQAMNRFWRLHENELIGLTRYFSLSFVSKPEDSHIFMKVTKMIGQFDEDNDGIVGLSSSKFPPRLMPTDLGVVEADHLSGILSSSLPQKAFFRAIVKSLAELGIENQNLLQKWKQISILNAAPKLVDNKYSFSVNSSEHTVKFKKAGITHWRTEKITNYADPYELNKILFSGQQDPLANYEPSTELPPNQLGFDPYQPLDMSKLPDVLSTKKVTPLDAKFFKDGIDLSFNQKDVLYYRMDHQFSYESRSPVDGDNNSESGLQSVIGSDKSPWLALRSKNNSYRMTTLAYRFKPTEYNNLNLTLKVTAGPKGADPVKGHSGKDDSAFQLWFTLRDLRHVKDRALGNKENTKVYLFGYYWGEEIPGEKRPAGSLYEEYYSNKNVVITTLPPCFEVVLNSGNEKLGQVVDYNRDLVTDIKRAYPDLDINQLEVIALTLQMDSNDTSSSSEAFMKTLKILHNPSIPVPLRMAEVNSPL